MADGEDGAQGAETELDTVGFADELADDHGGADLGKGGESDEVIVEFADDGEESPDDTPLVKKLRQQLREAHRANRRPAAENDDDPEPVVPARKTIADFEYDGDKFDTYCDEREKAVEARAKWLARDDVRKAKREAAAQEQTRRIEQQKRALGVGDYDQRASVVQERLTEQQLAVLLNASDDPAKMIYALGRSEAKLDALAGETNLARFAAQIGRLEKEIKVTKRTAPAPERRVTGATAPTNSGDKELERLEREAEKSGDRSKVIAYKRSQRAA